MLAKMKKFTFLWGALLFLVTIIMLYMMLDTLNTFPKASNLEPQQHEMLEIKLAQIENDIQNNKQVMKKIKEEMVELLRKGVVSVDDIIRILGDMETQKTISGLKQGVTAASPINISKVRKEEVYEVELRKSAKPSTGVCQWVKGAFSSAEINVHKLIADNPFDDKDGGAWKQGWAVTYPPNRWTAVNKLKIILVPHTHCDPGWIKTFADYYHTQTKMILNNFVPKLEQSSKYKFMFSEISYFSLWWSEISSEMKDKVRNLIAKGQFEISTGGWVMTDEANAHYYAMLDQMIEGHQWLNNTLGHVPQSGWAVDPFGYSSTMAYLLKRSDFKSMLIQRVHYSLKKQLAKESNLEFMWRQHWDSQADTDIFTHLMPFYSYDIPHTCGPEPSICCQFDFRRLPGSPYRCPWKIDPQSITQGNVAERTETILDQWKKKATLYKTNVVLAPLGDDFRYMQADEFDLQFGNYEKIFQYLDEHPELGAEAKFGTLTDYFNALYADTHTTPGQTPPNIPSLSGDFFSYADREDHYWTGYFTSRPLQKSMDRSLEHNLRSAEILFSLALSQMRIHSVTSFPSKALMSKLVEARRSLGLFQHHDAITGTAKDFVMVDYGKRLLKAFEDTKTIIRECSTFLLMETKAQYERVEDAPIFLSDEIRTSHESLPQRPVMELTDTPKPILLYNSLAQPRTEVVKLWVNWPHVEVSNSQGEVIHSQVEPFWSETGTITEDRFKVSFVAQMPGLAIQIYTIKKVERGADVKNHIASVTIFTADANLNVKGGPFSVETQQDDADFTLTTKFLAATFSGTTGLLKSVKSLSGGQVYKSELEFIQYGTRMAQDRSGAYLFLPDGDAKPLLVSKPNLIRIIKGPITSEVHVFIQYIQHVVRLHNSPGTDGSSVDMYNIVDIRNSYNKEVGMRIHTKVENTRQIFYSDLNGFQMQQRKYYSKLTLQGNVYPMSTMAYFQDSETRFSILSAHSSGVANLVSGALDVMFDRRLNQDDNRGLGGGVLDNNPTPNRFRLLFESRMEKLEETHAKSSFPSLLGHQSSLSLIHPIFIMPGSQQGSAPNLMKQLLLLQKPLPCDLHLLNLRVLQNSDDQADLQFVPRESSLLLLRHLPSDCSFPGLSLSCTEGNGQVILSELFSNTEIKKSVRTSLTMTKKIMDVSPTSSIQVPPMEIVAVLLDLS